MLIELTEEKVQVYEHEITQKNLLVENLSKVNKELMDQQQGLKGKELEILK